ncbi:MAG: hypothetical protein AAGE37_09750 [Pseudomonadota bacterium]
MFRRYSLLAVFALLACNPAVDSPEEELLPEIREFDINVVASGKATNPCLKVPELSGFWIELAARNANARLDLDATETLALDDTGKSWEARSFIPKAPFGYDLESTGSKMICGGSGGITIEGSEKTWGSVRESNVIFHRSGEGEPPNRFRYTFRKDGGLTLGLFFAAPFDDITAIKLSNGQLIARDDWRKP